MKRIISIFMAMVMVFGVCPAAAFAQDETVILDGVEIVLQDGFDSTGINFVAFGATGVSDDDQAVAEYGLPESGRYSLIIHRAGDLTQESMIMVGTLDVSAKYGKDYRVLDGDYVLELGENGKTLIERYMVPENRVTDSGETVQTTTGAAINAEEESLELQEETPKAAESPAEPEAAAEPKTPAEPETAAEPAESEKSALALLKEQQTGKPTRENTGEAVSAADSLMQSIGFNPVEVIEPSAAIGIIFAPGETEKEIVFEIINDSESEGKEVFDFDISSLDETTYAVSPYTCSIVIEDDEPVEHSRVVFSAASFSADSSEAVISIERTGADYTYATVGFRTVADGDAREGLDYAAIDMELEFLPNQMETSVTVPVVCGTVSRSFSVELYDARGCVLGSSAKANVTIPKEPEQIALFRSNSGELQESGGYKAGSTFTADGTNYKLAAMEGSTAFKIIANSNVGERYVGIFYPPKTDWFSYGRWGDEPNSSSQWKYSEGTISGQPGPVGYLYWYSNWCWDYGGCYGKIRLTNPWIFQTGYMDIKVDSGLNSVNMGFVGYFNNKSGGRIQTNDFRVGDTADRAIKGPATTFKKVAEGVYKYAGSYDGEVLELHANAERTGFSAARPEAWFWGTPLFFREFYVTQSDPAPMEYKTIDNDGNMTTTKRLPAEVKMLTTNGRYLYERVTFTCSPYESSVIGGTLIGFNIKAEGTEKVVFRANENNGGDDGFTIDEALLKELDKLGATATKNSGNHYVTTLDVTPVFQYKDVKVEVIRDTTYEGNSVGSFRYENELKNNTWHVGDELPMAAVVSDEYKGRYEYQTYIAYGCVNPGDPQSAYAEKLNPDRYLDHKSFTLAMKKYFVTPEFSDEGNYIAVKLDAEASKYFYFPDGDMLTAAEVNVSGNQTMKNLAAQGYRIMRTAAADKFTPTPSMAYSVRLLETAENGGNYRPVFDNNWNNAHVQGYSFDMLASALPARNIIYISAEKVDQSAYRYMVLEGKVQYSSVSMRDTSQDVRNVPAAGVSVFGSANPISGAMPGTSMLRISAASDQDGAFDINGVRAIPGDTISVLCQHEGVWQVRYFKLPTSALEEEREINVGRFDPSTGKVVYELKTEKAMIINLNDAERSGQDVDGERDRDSGIINLPIRTNYTPYIRNFYYSHSNYPKGNTMGNTVEIVDQDSVWFNIEVENNGVSVSAVKLRFMKNGVEQFVEKAVPTGPNSKTYRGYVGSDRLIPGLKLEFQIESPEKNKAQFDTEGVEKDQEVEKIFPSIDSGLTFYVPDEAAPSQEISVEFPDELGKMPMLGKLSQNVGSGKLIYEVEYENKNDPQSGYRFNTVGLSVSIDVDQKHREQLGKNLKEKLNNIRSTGGAKAQQDAKQSYNDAGAAEHAARQAAAYNDIDIDPRYTTDRERQDAKDAWDASNPVKAFQEAAYKNGLVEMADNKVTVGVTFMLRFEYLYDTDENSWTWTGTEIYFNAYVQAGKTIPTLLFGCPVYLYVGGKISVTFEFAFSYDSAEGEDGLVMRRRVKESEKKSGNITAVMSSGSPWITIAGSITIYGGIGVNGILSIRGVGSLNLALKFNFDSRWDPNFGFYWQAAGGIGFDALLISANIMLAGIEGRYGAIYKTTPKFKKDNNSGKLSGNIVGPDDTPTQVEPKVVFSALDMGTETYSTFGDGAFSTEEDLYLQSTLVPTGEKDILRGTLEYVRPVVVELDQNRSMLIFLKNMAGDNRNTANASSLCYAIGTKTAGTDGKETMVWGNITEIQKDATFDTMPAALKLGDDIYIAWSNAEASGNTDLSSVKKDLQDMNIRLAKLKKSTGYKLDNSFGNGGIMVISDDDFLNYGTRLVNENGNIALYYLKKDLAKASTEEELLDFSTNYSTWARTIVSPDGNIVPQKTAKGADVSEYMIDIAHPTLTDPFVSQYMVGTYTLAQSQTYRIAVYTIAKSGDSGNTELWAKIDNLTTGRSFYPIQISEGSESLTQPQLAQIRRKGVIDMQLHTSVVDDLMLTWITDGTKLHSISAHDVFNYIQYEDGSIPDDPDIITGTGSTLSILRSLTDAEISLPNWPARARDKMYNSLSQNAFKEQFDIRYPLLSAISDDTVWLEDLGTVKDFGNTIQRTSVDSNGHETEESYSTGLTLESYHIVTGDDNRVYMFWTWPLSLSAGASGDILTGNEIWGSSFETDIDTGNGSLSRGWSDPVQVTDYKLRADAKDYPYGRVLDEICPIVGTDSGALILGNSYDISYDSDGAIVYGKHNLTEIVCESQGSLVVEDIHLETENTLTAASHPLPTSESGNKPTIAVTVKNDGLLPARDYTYRIDCSVDGKAAQNIYTYTATGADGDDDTIYAGTSRTFYFENFTVPDFSGSIKLTATAKEFKPETTTPYTSGGSEISDTKEFVIKRESVLDFMPYYMGEFDEISYMSFGDLDRLTAQYGYGMETFIAKIDELVKDYDDFDDVFEILTSMDIRPYFLYESFGDVESMLYSLLGEMVVDNTIPIVVFIPVKNQGNAASGKLEIEIVKENYKTNDEGERETVSQTVGTASYGPVEAGAYEYIPVVAKLKPEMINDLGGTMLNVHITSGGKRVDGDDLCFGYKTNNNVKVTLDSADPVHKVTYNTAGDKMLNLKTGDSVALSMSSYPFNSKASFSYLVTGTGNSINDTVIAMGSDGSLKALKPGTAVIAVHDDSNEYALFDVIKVTVSDTPDGGGSGGGSGGGGGGSSSGGGSATPAKPNADGTSTTTTNNADGTKTETTKKTDGTTVAVTTDKNGAAVSVTATVSKTAADEAAKTGEAVVLPMTAAKDGEIKIDIPDGTTVDVAIPTGNAKTSTVVYIVRPDGTEELIKDCDVQNGIVSAKLDSDCTIVIRDNEKRFGDVDKSRWSYDAIDFVTSRQIFNGNGDGTFEPFSKVSRGMMAQVLFNLDRNARAADAESFTDSEAFLWFGDAIGWAAEEGIVNGNPDGSFGVNDDVNREQTVTMLFRYAQKIGLDTEKRASLDSFPDAASVRDYSRDAMRWAVAVGLINGNDGKLDPEGSADREQLATMMMRFVKLMH